MEAASPVSVRKHLFGYARSEGCWVRIPIEAIFVLAEWVGRRRRGPAVEAWKFSRQLIGPSLLAL
jgi:hypothetical protein